MNNPQVRSWCVALGRQATAASDPTRGVSGLYRAILSRDPSAEETTIATEFLADQTSSYSAGGKADAASLAWADFCQTLFGLNEFVFVE